MLFICLTGTPATKADKNTFWAFGAADDQGIICPDILSRIP
jgi:hypothetical protein